MLIGIDVGGTNLKAGLVEDRHLIASKSIPFEKGLSDDAFAETLVQLALSLTAENGVSPDAIESVGIGVPGTVDDRTGTVVFACNLFLKDLPLRKLFQSKWNVPVRLGNDANCAALGEYYAGAGQGSQSLIVVTLGTGIGGGIVWNGMLCDGVGGGAGEIGHMSIAIDGEPCNCGRRGCWERYASASALRRMAIAEMHNAPQSKMWELCDGVPEKADGRTAFLAAAQGDAPAQAVCDQYISYLATGIVNLINLIQPEVIAIGGGVSNAGDALLIPLRQKVAGECYDSGDRMKTRIVRAERGNDAGMIGAAMLGKSAKGEACL